MAKEATELVCAQSGFSYRSLRPAEAERLQRMARTIREKINKSLRSLIEAGQALVAVKEVLPHGQFGGWIEAEFGWSARTAQRLMEVAEQFGSKSDILSDLAIPTTALYLLAAPSTPFEARQAAIDRAISGEKITPALATEIIRDARKKAPRRARKLPLPKLARRLQVTLARFREKYPPGQVHEYARQLRDYVDTLEREMRRAPFDGEKIAEKITNGKSFLD